MNLKKIFKKALIRSDGHFNYHGKHRNMLTDAADRK